MTYRMTGHLRKDPATGEIGGEIRDEWGFSYVLTCTRAADGYEIIATRGPTPDNAKIPFLDDEA